MTVHMMGIKYFPGDIVVGPSITSVAYGADMLSYTRAKVEAKRLVVNIREPRVSDLNGEGQPEYILFVNRYPNPPHALVERLTQLRHCFHQSHKTSCLLQSKVQIHG